MAAWGADDETSVAVDFRLAGNSFVTLFWQRSVLGQTVGWLREHGYEVVSFDAATWASADAMFDDLARGLGFPSYFGRNLAALNDCMSDVARGAYGWGADATGLVIVLTGFDAFAEIDRPTAQQLLDIVAGQARSAILIGNRILSLAQTDDPRLSFEPVGAMPVVWNPAEWSNAKRGL